MLFQKILVPYDLSKTSNHAFKVALDIAQKYGSTITILTCVEGDAWHHRFYDSRADDELLKKQKKVSLDHIKKLEDMANKHNVQTKSRILKTMSVVTQIIDFAKMGKIDLVVMGSHGRTGIDKLILGSVANGVVNKIRCPVLIVK